jgi:hypothetical protein
MSRSTFDSHIGAGTQLEKVRESGVKREVCVEVFDLEPDFVDAQVGHAEQDIGIRRCLRCG